MGFLIRLLVNAAALKPPLTPGTMRVATMPFVAVALVFGIVNAIIGPVVKVLALPRIILRLGIFALIVNGLMPWLTSALSESQPGVLR
jgi:putative membrane protein